MNKLQTFANILSAITTLKTECEKLTKEEITVISKTIANIDTETTSDLFNQIANTFSCDITPASYPEELVHSEPKVCDKYTAPTVEDNDLTEEEIIANWYINDTTDTITCEIIYDENSGIILPPYLHARNITGIVTDPDLNWEWAHLPNTALWFSRNGEAGIYFRKNMYILSTTLSGHGHPMVTWPKTPGFVKAYIVASKMAELFLHGPVSAQVRHIDGDAKNCKLSNLTCDTTLISRRNYKCTPADAILIARVLVCCKGDINKTHERLKTLRRTDISNSAIGRIRRKELFPALTDDYFTIVNAKKFVPVERMDYGDAIE